MKMKLIALLFLLLGSMQVFATFPERVELMKYSIDQEALHQLETEWEEVSLFERLKLIQEAHAYSDGDTCMILGFKSQFKNGMCRLSKAEGIKNYKSQCKVGSLPCNPQVFGKPSQNGLFCVPQSAGQELSKYCAHKTISHLGEKSKSSDLKEAAKLTPHQFDLKKLDISKLDDATSKMAESLFSEKDSSLESAIGFMDNLCGDLQANKSIKKKNSKMQKMDLDNCQKYLGVLKQAKLPLPVAEKKFPAELKRVDASPSANVAEKVALPQIKAVKMEPSKVVTKPEVECEQPAVQPDAAIRDQVETIEKVTDFTEAQRWVSCQKSLEKNDVIAEAIKSQKDYNKEIGQNFSFWHKTNGGEYFGRACETPEGKKIVLLGKDGFLQASYPKDVNQATYIALKTAYKDQEYYIVQDMLGDYFEMIPVEKKSGLSEAVRVAIKGYESKAGRPVNKITVPNASQMEDVQSCVKDRFTEYSKWMIARNHKVIPTFNEVFKDKDNVLYLTYKRDYDRMVKALNGSDPSAKKELLEKYGRSLEELQEESLKNFKESFKECESIVSDDAYRNAYDKVVKEDNRRYYNNIRTNMKNAGWPIQ